MLARRTRSVVIISAGLVFGACASESVECPSGYCGQLVAILYSEPNSLLPAAARSADDLTVTNLVFFPLADIGPDLNTTDPSTFIPRLARAWAFEDSLTLRFTMDRNARWHDGTPVTAHDVAFTFSVYADTIINAVPRSYLESIDYVTARDDTTAVFVFNRRHREQFYTATYHMRILPRHLLDSIPRTSLRAHPVNDRPIGNGPYKFVRWNRGRSIELIADTTFFLGRPGTPRIEWRVANDVNTILTPMLSEDADVLSNVLGPENIALAQRTPHLHVLRYPGDHYGYMAFNLVDPRNRRSPHPLLADPDVRRAIAQAVDRGLVARTAHGDSARAPSQPATRVGRVFQDTVRVLPFDTAAARAALEAEGWRDTNGDGVLDRNGQPFRFELLVPTTSAPRMQSAAVITSLLRQAGIEVVQAPVEFGVFIDRITNGNFDAYIGTWSVQPSPAGYPNLWTSVGIGGQNYGSYASAAVDSLVRGAMLEPNPGREMALWREAFDAMNADPPAIWLYSPPNFAAVHRRFENVTLRPDRWSATLWQWRVRDGEWLPRDVQTP